MQPELKLFQSCCRIFEHAVERLQLWKSFSFYHSIRLSANVSISTSRSRPTAISKSVLIFWTATWSSTYVSADRLLSLTRTIAVLGLTREARIPSWLSARLMASGKNTTSSLTRLNCSTSLS